MNGSVQTGRAFFPLVLRAVALSAGTAVIVLWLQFVLVEWVRHGPPDLRSFHQVLQAATLAVVFAGYLMGWRNELAGGLISIIGTLAFGAVCTLTFDEWFPISWAWFAAPGLLYLFAWYFERKYYKLVL